MPWIFLGLAALVALGFAIKCVSSGRQLARVRADVARDQARANESKAQARALQARLDDAPVGWIEVPPGAGTLNLSPRAAALLGCTDRPAEVPLEGFLDLFASDQRAALAQRIEEAWTAASGADGDPPQDLATARGDRNFSLVQGAIPEESDAPRRFWLQETTRLQAALRRVEEQKDALREVLDGLPLAVWSRDADGILADCNKQYAAALETGHDAVLAAGLELVGQSRRSEALALARRAQESADGSASEAFHVVIQGARHLLKVTETRLASGSLLGFAEDGTVQEELQREVRRHLESEQEVFENLGTAIAIYGADMHNTLSNSAYHQLFEIDEAFIQTRPHFGDVLEYLRDRRKLPEQPDFPAYKQDLIKSYSTMIEPAEELLHLPDGTTLRELAFPYPLGGVLLSYEDVTDRLAMERNYNTLIAVQRETLDKLYEGVAVYGAEGRLQLFNPGFAKIWNLSPSWLAGKPHVRDIMLRCRPFFGIYDDAEWESYVEHSVSATTEPQLRSGRRERIDGSVFDWAQVPLPDGQVLYSFVDVTDSILVERALLERNEALETADRLKSEFIANVSYELRTPLNAIIGFAEILGNQFFGTLNERQVEYSNSIVEASQRLITLINDILDLATIEAGYLHIDMAEVDIAELLESVCVLGRERARNRQVDLRLDCPPDIGLLQADPRRLKQALFNLLSNALKYTPEGGRITISAERRPDEVLLTVTDTGVGITEEDKERVFASFERGRQRGGQPGAGLGLSLVRSLIELHGGQVQLDSKVDDGTKVVCHVPAPGTGHT